MSEVLTTPNAGNFLPIKGIFGAIKRANQKRQLSAIGKRAFRLEEGKFRKGAVSAEVKKGFNEHTVVTVNQQPLPCRLIETSVEVIRDDWTGEPTRITGTQTTNNELKSVEANLLNGEVEAKGLRIGQLLSTLKHVARMEPIEG